MYVTLLISGFNNLFVLNSLDRKQKLIKLLFKNFFMYFKFSTLLVVFLLIFVKLTVFCNKTQTENEKFTFKISNLDQIKLTY